MQTRWDSMILPVVHSSEGSRLSFQPFAVQCLTCSRHLRVNDPKIVGSIATCPNCQSMVEILPPGENPIPSDENQTSESPTFDSQAITEETLGSEQQRTSLGLAPPTASGFADNGETSSGAPPVMSGTGVQWESDDARRKKQVGLVVAISALSLLLCLAGFAWFVKSWTSDQPTASVQIDHDQKADKSITGDEAVLLSDPSSTSESEATQDAVEVISPDDPDSNLQSSQNQSPGNQSLGNGSTDNSGIEMNQDVTSEQPRTPNPSGTVPSDLLPVSPLDETPPIPSNLPNPNVANTEDNPASEESAGMQELPPGLAQYTRFLLEEGDIEETNLEAPPSMDDLDLDEATQELDRPVAPLRPKDINIDAVLSVKLAIDTDGYALPELALLISQITGLPIQIDWVSFDLGEKDLTKRQPLPQGWKSAREILEAICEPFGAEIRDEESMVIVTLSDDTFSSIRSEIAALDDFEESQLSSADLLSELLGHEVKDQQIQLDTQTRQDQQLALITIEALRRAKKLAPKVSNEFLSKWIGSPENPSSTWSLPIDGQSFPQSDVPISIAEFIGRLSNENGVQSLINWEDFTVRLVNPEQVFMPYSGKDAASTFDHAFARFGIEVRQVNPNHWWIGQRSTYDRLPVVSWTDPLSNETKTTQDELRSRLNQIIDPSKYRVAVDAETNRGILILPRYLAEQLPKITEGLLLQER
ncbi:hypothetical protein N9D38_00900 [Rubripirellula sp.]|nr:hypothetical protein [Rubripirellula sp.]